MEEEKKEEEATVDALEFAPEVDILPTFTMEWQEATAAIKKWNEKKDKLEEIVAACKNKKVKPGHFDNLSTFLKKEIAATNINTSLAAIDAATAIGEGMRLPFVPKSRFFSQLSLKSSRKREESFKSLVIISVMLLLSALILRSSDRNIFPPLLILLQVSKLEHLSSLNGLLSSPTSTSSKMLLENFYQPW